MEQTNWQQLAQHAIDYLAPYAPVIILGLESAKRQSGRPIDRKQFVNAKSVYAVLKADFERDINDKGRALLEAFIREPARYRDQLIALVSARAAAAPDDFGRKLVTITNRLYQDSPLP